MTIRQLSSLLDAIQSIDSPDIPVLCEFEFGEPPSEIGEITLAWKNGAISGVILS